jgi:hypothetical protein
LANWITFNAALKNGTTTASNGVDPVFPLSAFQFITVPSETTFANVPLDSAIVSNASEKNAATGNDRKLAAANPMAASNAIQKRIINRPRLKFSPNPPSGYNTSTPSSNENNSVVRFIFWNPIVNTPFASNLFGGISNS